MVTVPELAGEKDQRGLDSRSIHGKYVEHNPEIRHPISDESGVEPAHLARGDRENDGVH